MTSNIIDNLLEIKSSTYPEDIRVIRRKSDGYVFGCVVYENASRHTASDFEEIDKPEEPEEETEEETDGNSDGIDN